MNTKNIGRIYNYTFEGWGRVLVPLMFLGLIVLMHVLLRKLQVVSWFIMHPLWPLSVVKLSNFRLQDLLLVGGLLSLYLLMVEILKKKKSSYRYLVFVLLALIIVLSNLLQGYRWGLIHPLTGYDFHDVKYWQDQAAVESPLNYLKNYTTLQPTLGHHSRVHPPGPVFLSWLLRSTLQNELLIASTLFLGGLSVVWISYRWMRTEIGEKNALYTAVLLGLLPASQIYLWFSMDGIIAALFLFTLWKFCRTSKSNSLILTILGLLASSLMTFAVMWLVAVMILLAWKNNKLRDKLRKALIGLVIILFGLSKLTGYDYLDSMLLAKSFEGFSGGFYGLVEPLSYVVTRVQDVLEPLVFLGPFVGLLVVLSFMQKSKHNFGSLAKFGVICFLGFIAAGAYYTGETARAAYYVIPPLIMFLGTKDILGKLSNKAKYFLLNAVMLQTVIMQVFFYWTW